MARGQLNLILQSEDRPGTILNAISEIVTPKSEALTLAVAYVTPDGVDALIDRLSLRLAPRSIKDLTASIVTSFDNGWSVPRAIRMLADDYAFDVRIANLRPGTSIPRKTKSFHPKMYLGHAPASCGLFVGSANLTARALTVNSEAGYLELNLLPKFATEIRDEVLTWGVPLTAELLDDYSAWRPRQRPPDPPPQQPMVPLAGTLPTLQEAIVAGTIDPSSLSFLWVEAGSMSSGGSHNQLELPRGANRFFGFAYSAYPTVVQQSIGPVRIVIPGRADVSCPLTWHGHNGMERLNLPTKSKGGYDYANSVVLFEKRHNHFVLHVEPQSSYAANAWRVASLKAKWLFRLGLVSPRRCGLF